MSKDKYYDIKKLKPNKLINVKLQEYNSLIRIGNEELLTNYIMVQKDINELITNDYDQKIFEEMCNQQIILKNEILRRMENGKR